MRSVLMELLFLMFDLCFSPKKDYIKRQKFTKQVKELSFCHKLKFSNPYIYGTWCCRLLIFQTKIIWCNKIRSLKYLRSTTLGCRHIEIRKSEFVTKTQFLYDKDHIIINFNLLNSWTQRKNVDNLEVNK